MKHNSRSENEGSILMIALLSITVLTLICATSLYIASQNSNAGMQTAAWQQSLTAAESGVDAAVRALNTGVWTNWKTVSTATLPGTEPANGTGSNASANPTTSQYNYLPSSALALTMQGEGAPTVSGWVTVDTAGGLSDSSGSWYRIRSSGQTTFQSNSIFKRVSNNRLDSDLRNTITMNFNRKGGSNLGPSRTIEVIMQPIPQGGTAKGITLANWLAMTGGGSADAFSSPNGQWSSIYRDATNPLIVAEGATGNSAKFANTGQTYVYGGVAYSGTAPTNVNANSGNPPVKDVAGQVSTPAVVNLPTPTDPTPVSGQSGHYTWMYQNPWSGVTSNYSFNSNTALSGGGGLPKNSSNVTVTAITANGTSGSPGLIIINGDFTVPGGTTFTIKPTTTGNPPVADPTNSNVIVWVTGKFTTSGSGLITQVAGTNVTWIVDNDITVSGDSYSNQNGKAATDSFVGIGAHKFTDSGSGTFTGTVNAPAYDGTVSGSGDYTGAFAGSSLTISGSGNFHYDESLSGGGSNPTVGNYAYASWFEDNSDPTHKDVNQNYVIY
jgi:hypothetical protein